MFNRRQFLTTSAAAAAGSLLPIASWANAENSQSKIKNVGLQLWSIAKYLEQDFAKTIDLVSRIGYKELELFGPYPFSSEKDKATWRSITGMVGFTQSGYFNHTAKDFKKLLDKKRMKTTAMHIGLDTLRNHMGATAEAAHILGQKYAGIASIPEEERKTLDDYKRIADEFNRIGEKAKAEGIRFYYHNHGYGLTEMEGKIPFDIILERTDPSLVYLEMDLFWTVAGRADPVKYFDTHPGRYKLMHVKDMSKLVHFSGDGGNPKQWVELFPYIRDAGSGVLDLQTILSHAKKSGVTHFIVENDVITNVKDSLEKGYRYVSSLQLKD